MYKLDNYSELPTTSGIYFIINTINQKYYLGRAKNIKERLSQHNRNYMSSAYLQNAINKYSKENFKIKIIEYPNITEAELIKIEQKLLDKHVGLPLCYNLSSFASGGCVSGENSHCYGKIWCNNGTKNIRISPEVEIPEGYTLGIKEETKKKNRRENHPNYGKSWYNNGLENRYFSPEEEIPEGFFMGINGETRKKQSEAKKGKPARTKIKVITETCCYYSVTDAMTELGIPPKKFYKLFEKNLISGFYVPNHITE